MEQHDIVIVDREIDGPMGSIPVRIYAPQGGTASPGLVWNHGGSFVVGDLDMPEAHWVSSELAASGIVVVSVFYRLCNEQVHYPVPSDDVRAAYLWTVENAGQLGIDPERLSLGGASAGSCLAGGVAKRIRDEGGPHPRSVLLVYPIVHPVLPPLSPELAETVSRMNPTDVFSAPVLEEMAATYLGTTPPTHPYAYPSNGDLEGLPPTFILNVEHDNLRASGEAYGAALAAAGVDVLMLREPDSGHGHINRPDEDGAQRSVQRMAQWLLGTALVGERHLRHSPDLTRG